jgi:hypothetical protein
VTTGRLTIARRGRYRGKAFRHLPTREESMKKLKIEIDALSVESFETSRPAPDAGGTVHGQEARTLYEISCYCTYPTGTQNEEGAAIACGG